MLAGCLPTATNICNLQPAFLAHLLACLPTCRLHMWPLRSRALGVPWLGQPGAGNRRLALVADCLPAAEQLLDPKRCPPVSLAGPMLSLEQSLKPPGTHAHRSYGPPSPANAIHEHARAHLCAIAWSLFCACPCMPALAFMCLGAHGCTLACRCRHMWVNAWLMLLVPLQLPCSSGGR